MKDIILPSLTNEESLTIFKKLNVGDILVKIERNYYNDDYHISYHKIIRKTQKGRLRLDNSELLETLYSHYYVLNDETKQCIKKILLKQEIMNLLYEINRDKKKFKANLTYKDAIELKKY